MTPVLTRKLDPIVDEFASLMTAGDWVAAIRRVREAAGELAVESDDLVRQVAARAIERGLVRPLCMEPMQ